MIYLSLEEVVRIHDFLIEKIGGLSGIRDVAILESAIANPMTAVFGQELHPSIFDKAASYLYSISRNHPFLDGNKRTATACSLTFLRVNGKKPKYKIQEFENFIVEVAEGNKSHEEISDYLKKMCK